MGELIMGNFVEVNEKFKEICDHYFNDSGCQSCPLVDNCYDPPENPQKVEEIVMNWKPANIYPTIFELIQYMAGYLPARKDGKHWYEVPLNELTRNRIPEEIAKKFGIMPINACGLNKYVDDDEMESEWR